LKKDEDDADGEATDDLSGDSFKSTEKISMTFYFY
jgi:hypothetical protein